MASADGDLPYTAGVIEGGGYYFRASDAPPPFSADNLRARIHLGELSGRTAEEFAEWWPGKPNPRQLVGTLRTLDMVDGSAEMNCAALPPEVPLLL